MKRVNKKLLIIVPAYNQEKVIEETLKQIKKEIKLIKNIKTDLLVVNDGSKDNTRVLSKKHANEVSHLVNMGSGAATRTGLKYAKRNNYKYAITIDADGQHSPKDMLKIINHLIKTDNDLVIGSRLINSSGMPLNRILGNNILNFITRVLLGVRVTDSQSGLKGFSRKAIDTIEIKTNGYEFCAEIIWKASKNNLIISEIPIKAIYTEYSKAKGQSNINALRIIKSIIVQKIKEV
jgi:glycosyltransferase involved in cell wall biosynthesis